MIQRAFGANDVMKHVLDWFWVIAEESTFGDRRATNVRLLRTEMGGCWWIGYLRMSCWFIRLVLKYLRKPGRSCIGGMLVFPQPVLGKDVISKDEEELEADLMSKWMLDCTLSSGATVRGGAKIAANVDKGKNTMEEDEEFMKAEKENNE
ncbi:hypothetical protein ACFX2G_042011 [Malus domestica]